MSDSQNVPVTAIPYEIYRAQDAVKAVQEAAALKMDQTVPGGVYIDASGQKVDANGVPIKEAQEAEPEQTLSGYGASTVAELRHIMEARNVEAPSGANKADLIAALEAADQAEAGS